MEQLKETKSGFQLLEVQTKQLIQQQIAIFNKMNYKFKANSIT